VLLAEQRCRVLLNVDYDWCEAFFSSYNRHTKLHCLWSATMRR